MGDGPNTQEKVTEKVKTFLEENNLMPAAEEPDKADASPNALSGLFTKKDGSLNFASIITTVLFSGAGAFFGAGSGIVGVLAGALLGGGGGLIAGQLLTPLFNSVSQMAVFGGNGKSLNIPDGPKPAIDLTVNPELSINQPGKEAANVTLLLPNSKRFASLREKVQKLDKLSADYKEFEGMSSLDPRSGGLKNRTQKNLLLMAECDSNMEKWQTEAQNWNDNNRLDLQAAYNNARSGFALPEIAILEAPVAKPFDWGALQENRDRLISFGKNNFIEEHMSYDDGADSKLEQAWDAKSEHEQLKYAHNKLNKVMPDPDSYLDYSKMSDTIGGKQSWSRWNNINNVGWKVMTFSPIVEVMPEAKRLKNRVLGFFSPKGPVSREDAERAFAVHCASDAMICFREHLATEEIPGTVGATEEYKMYNIDYLRDRIKEGKKFIRESEGAARVEGEKEWEKASILVDMLELKQDSEWYRRASAAELRDFFTETANKEFKVFQTQNERILTDVELLNTQLKSLEANNLKILARAEGKGTDPSYLTFKDTQSGKTMTVVGEKQGTEYKITQRYEGEYNPSASASTSVDGGMIADVFSEKGILNAKNLGEVLKQQANGGDTSVQLASASSQLSSEVHEQATQAGKDMKGVQHDDSSALPTSAPKYIAPSEEQNKGASPTH